MQDKNIQCSASHHDEDFASMPNLPSTHRCISNPHLVMMKTKTPPIRANATPVSTCQTRSKLREPNKTHKL